MIARNLISEDIIPLKPTDTGDDALALMNDYHTRHLPILDGKRLLGIVSEEEILDSELSDTVDKHISGIHHPYVNEGDHIYEIMRVLYETKLTIVPVINEEEEYLGAVSLTDLLKYFAESTSLSEQGSVVVLAIVKRDFALSQIARIVEGENALILNYFITSSPDTIELEITLKINKHDISRILAAFHRFGYEIRASFSESDYMNQLQENYESFMHFINV